jgi:hypothetical protein
MYFAGSRGQQVPSAELWPGGDPVFIGTKMCLIDVHKIPVAALGVVVGNLALTMWLSLRTANQKQGVTRSCTAAASVGCAALRQLSAAPFSVPMAELLGDPVTGSQFHR